MTYEEFRNRVEEQVKKSGIMMSFTEQDYIKHYISLFVYNEWISEENHQQNEKVGRGLH